MSKTLNQKIVTATKWSAITELIAKLVNPITTIVLAHLLMPEIFGIVTTITMIITFAEIFTDAGFQKYLIQHDFIDNQEKVESFNVAFWSNLFLSFFIWGCISIFSNRIANLVGIPGKGYVISIACVMIPIAAFSSIQMALYKRELNFKPLFKVRTVAILIPLIITIPIAYYLRSFWALIIGAIAKAITTAFLLSFYSKWKPQFFYSFEKLKKMLSFTIWSMIEAISIWMANYIDLFIVGTLLTQHYLGLYKTSTVLVAQITSIIVGSTTPILFSSLSKLQSNNDEFENLFLRFQKTLAILIIPIGLIIFFHSKLITFLVLGPQWQEASYFVGLWGVTSAFMIILAHYSSEVYRAKGKPKLSVLSQWLHLIVLWPAIIFSIRYGYDTLCTTRALVRFEGIAVNLVFMNFIIGISWIKQIRNIVHTCISATSIILFSIIWKLFFPISILSELFIIIISLFAYIMILQSFEEERKTILLFINKIKMKSKIR